MRIKKHTILLVLLVITILILTGVVALNLNNIPQSLNSPERTPTSENNSLSQPLHKVTPTILAVQIQTPTPSLNPGLITSINSWHYFKGIQDVPINWNIIEFDDSNWSVGEPGFGYGDDDDVTVFDDMAGNYLSVYFRQQFIVSDLEFVSPLFLAIDYDDGFVAYANGIEIGRRNVTGTPPLYNSTADSGHEAGQLEYLPVNPAVLIQGDNILAVQIHNRSLDSSDLSFNATLRHVSPYLQNVTQKSIVLMWESFGDPYLGKVRYRQLGDSTWSEASSPDENTIHEVLITELKPGTAYEYQISPDAYNYWTPIRPVIFNTAPALDQSFRIAIYGDTRTMPEAHKEVINAIKNTSPDLVFHTGDLVGSGKNYNVWGREFFIPLNDLIINTPLYPVLGNHEKYGSGKLWYFDLFSLPENEHWYAFSYSCSRFIILDSNDDFSPGSVQNTWLLNELESTEYTDSQWQVVFFHHPPFTSGKHPGDETPVEEYLVPLFERYGIDLVFSGHNHHYERSLKDNIYYVVTGGGGAPLYGFPNPELNPYSQVQIKTYHHTSIDFYCREHTIEFNAWNNTNALIDGPITLTR